MATFTTRLNATKPASSENVNITVLNDNADLFDLGVGSTIGTSASRPASAFSGRIYYATDSAKLFVNSASSASTAASWQDAVANALSGATTIGADLTMSAGAVNVTRSASSSNAFTAKVSGDAQTRLAVLADGKHNWSNGASAADTNLYRSAADTLKTDDSLIVGGTTTSIGAMSASTSLTVGGAATLNGGLTVVGKGSVEYVRKATTEAIISDSTLSNDAHINFSLTASAVYRLTCHLSVTGPTVGDFKTAWVFTGAASGGNHTNRYCLGPGVSVGSTSDTVMQSRAVNWTTAAAYGTDGTITSGITETGLLDTTAGSGTITLQWAQNVSTATSTSVSTSSYAILERLA